MKHRFLRTRAAVVGGVAVAILGTSGLLSASEPLESSPATSTVTIVPVRIVDTRIPLGAAGPLQQAQTLNVPIAGQYGVPAAATAAILNVTVVDGTAPSYLTLFPTGATRPNTSTINWLDGGAIANGVTMGLGTGGGVDVYNHAGSVQVIVDLQGYVAPADVVPGAPGAMCSTVGDLVAWTRMLHGGEVVSAASLREMTTPTVVASGDTIPYGFGLALGDLEGHRSVAHGGGINGFISMLAHYPEEGITVAVLTNAGSGPAGRVEEMVARAALGLELPRVEDRALTPELIERVAGTYAIDLGGEPLELTIFEEEGRLMAQAEGQGANRLRWQGGTTFIPTFDDQVRLVFEPADGPAERVTLHQGGAAMPGERVR